MKRPSYVEGVGRHLADVGWRQRQPLLDDLAVHLGEAELAPADLDAWNERFGSAESYARQLRVDLGLGVDPASLRRGQRPRFRTARLRTKVLTGVIVALIAILAVSTTWVANHQPLTTGNLVVGGGARSDRSRPPVHAWDWIEGGGFVIGTELRNAGRVPVRVTSVDLPAQLLVPWDNWRVTMSAEDRFATPTAPEVAMVPFTLAPGEHRWIWFRGEFETCPVDYTPGSGLGMKTTELTFEVLGIERHDTVPLGFSYEVRVAEPCG